MDPRLMAIAAAVERGEPVMPMGIIAGGWLVQGTPVPYAKFYADTYDSAGRQLHAAMPGREQRKYKGRSDELWDEFGPRIVRAMSSLGDPAVPDTLALNIAPAHVAIGDTTLYIPAVRVPLATVSAWWVTDFTLRKESPSSVGIGVMFPI